MVFVRKTAFSQAKGLFFPTASCQQRLHVTKQHSQIKPQALLLEIGGSSPFFK